MEKLALDSFCSLLTLPTQYPPHQRLRIHIQRFQLPFTRVAASPGVEGQLTQRALQDNKPIAYLETMAEFAEWADQYETQWRG